MADHGSDAPVRTVTYQGVPGAFSNIPAALYKALGGFATAGVNVVKIESYMVEGSFSTVQFYVEVEGHPEEERVQIAIDELRFYCSHTQILGVYPAHPYRSLRC